MILTRKLVAGFHPQNDTVGKRVIAELRGSLKNYAHGAFVTTSHYSNAAVQEAAALTKVPIVLMDGQAFAQVTEQFGLLT